MIPDGTSYLDTVCQMTSLAANVSVENLLNDEEWQQFVAAIKHSENIGLDAATCAAHLVAEFLGVGESAAPAPEPEVTDEERVKIDLHRRWFVSHVYKRIAEKTGHDYRELLCENEREIVRTRLYEAADADRPDRARGTAPKARALFEAHSDAIIAE
jgi:hypothetical protein